MRRPIRLLGIGFGLLIIGVVLPFLMMIGFVESTLFLNLLAIACSIGGLTTGLLGMARYFPRPK